MESHGICLSVYFTEPCPQGSSLLEPVSGPPSFLRLNSISALFCPSIHLSMDIRFASTIWLPQANIIFITVRFDHDPHSQRGILRLREGVACSHQLRRRIQPQDCLLKGPFSPSFQTSFYSHLRIFFSARR